MTKLRIDLAYCVELGRVVDIQEACIEFFAQTKHKKFNFLCSDPACRKANIKVTAVNHYRLPEDDETVFKSPHYRVWDDHLENCEWVQMDSALKAEEESVGIATLDEEERTRRRLRRKLTRLVTRFIIPETSADPEGDRLAVTGEFDRIRAIRVATDRRRALREYVRGIGSTATSLEALVTCYEELRALNETGQKLVIDGVGEMSFAELFRHISGRPGDGFSVLHGGATLEDRWGSKKGVRGASFRFYDKIADKRVTLYISKDAIAAYRPGARMARLFDEAEKQKRDAYVHIYWIGGLEDQGKLGWSATVRSLAHVVVRIVYRKGRPQDDPEETKDHESHEVVAEQNLVRP